MVIFIHIANVMYLASYLVRDILWLRCLTIVAGLVLMPFYFSREPVLWASVGWISVFTLINLYQIYQLLLERRPVSLTRDEQQVHARSFPALTPRQFKKLLAIATWEQAQPSACLIHENKPLERMLLIHAGRLSVETDGAALATLEAGAFVGEMSFLTGQAPQASVFAREDTTYVCWPVADLHAFLQAQPDIRAIWQRVIGTDLVCKLRAR